MQNYVYPCRSTTPYTPRGSEILYSSGGRRDSLLRGVQKKPSPCGSADGQTYYLLPGLQKKKISLQQRRHIISFQKCRKAILQDPMETIFLARWRDHLIGVQSTSFQESRETISFQKLRQTIFRSPQIPFPSRNPEKPFLSSSPERSSSRSPERPFPSRSLQRHHFQESRQTISFQDPEETTYPQESRETISFQDSGETI